MKNKLPTFSRRDFIRSLSTTAAALALGPVRIKEALAYNEGRKLGIALLGLGRYSTGQLGPALRETKLCQLKGVITGHPEKGQKWAADFGFPEKNIYNYDNMDRIADNRDIDIVYVVTPPALHPEFVIRAAKAGKAVISEKPMATSVADCDRMIAACKDAKVQLGIGYRLHYDPFHKEMWRLARTKEFGRFMKMNGEFAFVMRQREWRIDKKLGGGGPMMDLGIYVVHAACMAADAPIVAVTAQEEPKANPELFNEVEEKLRWTMEFESGAHCEGVTGFNHSGNTFRAEGDKGWFQFDRNAFSYSGAACTTSRGPMNAAPVNKQALQMDDFADCVLTGRRTSVPGELGRRDMVIVSAVYEAARTGQRVKVKIA
ncbi:MAG: glucose-fructose oxidoreductase [Blastocatellia bacterium]|nr:MAG: glucose-fructose oxidoreductase [Blastocatellia bacterium]